MKRVMPMVVMIACQSNAPEPTKIDRPHDVTPAADARLAAPAPIAPPDEPTATVASWSSKPSTTASPACISGGNNRFIQYADDAEPGALRFCLWWNLAKQGQPDAACWRVELATGTYTGQTGVWFATRQPPRVGFGGGAGTSAATAKATWRDNGVEVCRGTACKRVALTKPQDADEHEIAIDAAGALAVVPLGPDVHAKARTFATIETATGTQVGTLAITNRHEGAEAVGFLGSALVVTDCNPAVNTCSWDLYDPRTGKRIAAVGGASPLGAGGTAVTIDAQHFAAVAGSRLVVQAATGAVTATIQLPHPPKIGSDYVAFIHDASLAMLGPDGRVVLVDPATGKITRSIMPPACK